MKRKLKINTFFLLLILVVLIFVSGCASTGTQTKPAQLSTITAINIEDNQIDIIADKQFTYTVYKSSDPYKVIVELPDVRLGGFTGKIKSNKAGITEITPSQIEEPLSAKLEILLSSPVSIEPSYKETALAIKVQAEPVAKSAEMPAETAVEEAEVKEEAVAPKPQQEAAAPPKEIVPTAEVKKEAAAPKPQQEAAAPPKEIVPTAEVKEEVVAPKSELKAAKEPSPATEITQVSIEKVPGAIKVIIKGNGSLSPNVFRLDSRAVLDMPDVKLAAPLPAAVSPLIGIRVGKYKDKTRLVFDMKGGTSFDVTAVEGSVVVAFRIPAGERQQVAKAEKTTEVEAKAVVAPEKPDEGRYKGQKISLDFQDADIGPIFRLLADVSGYNFVIDPAVKGKITMKLMNVPWDQALDIILQTFNLGKSIEGNIVWIAPTTTFAKMAEDKAKAKDVEEKAEDLMQDTVRINYATASDISSAIDKGKLLSSRGSITVDNRMNTLIIKDTQKSIDKIRDLVKIMDVSKQQVMIEAKIVTVSSGYSENLGIQWGGSFQAPIWPNTFKGDFSVNTPVLAAGPGVSQTGGVLGMTIGNASTMQVQLSLQALESLDKAKTLSNPKILTLDNEAAVIQQGQAFFVTSVSAEGTKAEEKDATLSLSVKPKITPDGYVQLDITASDDTLQGGVGGASAVINKKSITTKALVKNGETLVLGGIYTTTIDETETGVPLLSRIPVLGWLFKTKIQTGPSVRELLIFITPTIASRAI